MFDAHRYQGRHRAPAPRTVPRALAVLTAGAAAAVLAPAAHAAPDEVWDRLAQCESSGNWSINTGNGYSGGLQFAPATWRGFGGAEFAPAAHQASRTEQIVVAERVLAAQGWNAWPACSRRLGIRGEPATPRSVARAAGAAAPRSEAAPAAQSASPRADGDGTHTVDFGDTLSEIAVDHGTSAVALFDGNRDVVEHPDLIFPGEQLRTP